MAYEAIFGPKGVSEVLSVDFSSIKKFSLPLPTYLPTEIFISPGKPTDKTDKTSGLAEAASQPLDFTWLGFVRK